MALKITHEHYTTIAEALNSIKPLLDEEEKKYANAGLSKERFRWDAFRFAKIDGNSTTWLCHNLYPYLNDDHIDSALRHYFGHKD